METRERHWTAVIAERWRQKMKMTDLVFLEAGQDWSSG